MASNKQDPGIARVQGIYRLLALDMDGTLLNSDKIITPDVHEAIRVYMRRGGRVAIASGRFPASVWLHARAAEMNAPLIAFNGAVILDEATGELKAGTPLPPEHVRELIRFADEHGAYIQLYGYNKLYVRELNEMNARWPLANVVVSPGKELNEQNYAEQLGMIEVVAVGDLQRFVSGSFLPTPPIYKATIIGPVPELVQEWMRLLGGGPQVSSKPQESPQLEQAQRATPLATPQAKPAFTLTRTGRHRFDVNAYGVSKRSALELLCRELYIERSEVAAVGDYDNDVDMLAWAGLGVAMGNAEPHIKQLAKAVTSSNEEDGVARVIHKFLL
ncbi:Cof-type HAD-IIB family hydrolase [Paenibacillus sp. YSY-4.3]